MNSSVIFKYIRMIVFVVILAIAFKYIGGEQLQYTMVKEEMPARESILSEPTNGTVIEQRFRTNVDYIQAISFQPFTYGRVKQGFFDFQLLSSGGEVIVSNEVEASACIDDSPYTISFENKIPVNRNELYTLRITFHGEEGINPTLFYSTGDSKYIEDEEMLTVNGNKIDGFLCISTNGLKKEIFGTYYWQFVLGLIFILSVYMAWMEHQRRRGKFTVITLFIAIWTKYKFLIQQLVSRDFKVKYKRSVLGYCWSFLNPLLTMLVQYVVFSTIFRTGIENYPVYLLSGNIIFSFFTDAVGQGLMSIIGNASLITKVYVPKYIYPATKVMSCSINLFISIIPLLLVTLLTGGSTNLTLLLLPYALICLLLFSMGMVLMLSAANVFFRDVQYLWGIISLIWMYATPLFYPAEIIPENLRFIQTINPMFHIISFVRSILIYGVSPSPELYVSCLVGSVIIFAIGIVVFKKTQGKFVLYI